MERWCQLIRNATVGERVRVLSLAVFGHERWANGVLVHRWPAGCFQGTITRKEIWHNQSPTLWVTPDDPAGVGETRFRPSELERLKTKDEGGRMKDERGCA